MEEGTAPELTSFSGVPIEQDSLENLKREVVQLRAAQQQCATSVVKLLAESQEKDLLVEEELAK